MSSLHMFHVAANGPCQPNESGKEWLGSYLPAFVQMMYLRFLPRDVAAPNRHVPLPHVLCASMTCMVSILDRAAGTERLLAMVQEAATLFNKAANVVTDLQEVHTVAVEETVMTTASASWFNSVILKWMAGVVHSIATNCNYYDVSDDADPKAHLRNMAQDVVSEIASLRTELESDAISSQEYFVVSELQAAAEKVIRDIR